MVSICRNGKSKDWLRHFYLVLQSQLQFLIFFKNFEKLNLLVDTSGNYSLSLVVKSQSQNGLLENMDILQNLHLLFIIEMHQRDKVSIRSNYQSLSHVLQDYKLFD
jgi:hypothetical protein